MDVDGVSAILYSSHMMLAALTKVQEFCIDDAEAKMLGKAIANVSKHYDVGVVSQQTLDWFNLIQVGALIYGPRIAAVRMKKTNAKREAREAAERAEMGVGGVPDGFQFATGGVNAGVH